MRQRWVSAIIGVFLLFAALLSPPYIIKICMVLVCGMCLYEVFCAFAFQKKPLFAGIGVLACLTFPFLKSLNTNYIETIIFIYIFVICVAMLFHNDKISCIDISILTFLLFLVPFCLSHLLYLREVEHVGYFYIWLPLIGAFCSDSGAFFIGRAFKGKKLCPNLSPNKTISGAIGGLFGSMVGFFAYSLILFYFYGINIDILAYYSLAIIASFASQCGDLTASTLKRHSHIKDFGNIMPGHGGLMDRVDGLIFSAPIVYTFIVSFGVQIFK